jgi:prepilin peptidase CpaA
MLLAFSQSWPSAIAASATLASGAVVLLAACHDIVSRTVPNWMSVAIACCGLVAAYFGDRLLLSFGLGLGVFVLAAICWRFGLLGGADVKLLGAIAIVLPLSLLGTFAIAMTFAGAVHALIYLIGRRVVTPPPRLAPKPAPAMASPSPGGSAKLSHRRPALTRVLRAERWRISRGGPLPYACAIAFGFLFVICNGAAP